MKYLYIEAGSGRFYVKMNSRKCPLQSLNVKPPPTHNCKEKPAALRQLGCRSHTLLGRKNDLDAANSSSHHPARRVREHSSTAPAKSQARDDGETRKGVVSPSVPTSTHARAPRLPAQGRRLPARSRAGAASLQSPYVCLLSGT